MDLIFMWYCAFALTAPWGWMEAAMRLLFSAQRDLSWI